MNGTTTDHCNVSESYGIFPQVDGTYLALTLTKSKSFKSRRGAEKWLARVWSAKYGHLA